MEIDALIRIIVPAVGAVVAVFVLVLKYYRPVYYSFSKKYNRTTISDTGELVEITVRNLGINSEENVRIEIANNLRAHLITDTEGVDVNASILCIARVCGASTVNVLLLVEGGTFSRDSVIYAKANSRDIKYRDVQEERYSYLQVLFFLAFLVASIVAIGAIGYVLGETQGRHGAKASLGQGEALSERNSDPAHIGRRAKLGALGWQGFDQLLLSKEFSQAYKDDFPVKLVNIYIKNGLRCFDFEVVNKLDDFFEVQVSVTKSFGGDKSRAKASPSSYWQGPVLPSKTAHFSIQEYFPEKNDEYRRYVFKFFITTALSIYSMSLSIDSDSL